VTVPNTRERGDEAMNNLEIRVNELLGLVYPSTARKLGRVQIEGRSVNPGNKQVNFSTVRQEITLVRVTTERRNNVEWKRRLYMVESEVVPIIALAMTEFLRDEMELEAGFVDYPFGINISVTVVIEELDGEELGSI